MWENNDYCAKCQNLFSPTKIFPSTLRLVSKFPTLFLFWIADSLPGSFGISSFSKSARRSLPCSFYALSIRSRYHWSSKPERSVYSASWWVMPATLREMITLGLLPSTSFCSRSFFKASLFNGLPLWTLSSSTTVCKSRDPFSMRVSEYSLFITCPGISNITCDSEELS